MVVTTASAMSLFWSMVSPPLAGTARLREAGTQSPSRPWMMIRIVMSMTLSISVPPFGIDRSLFPASVIPVGAARREFGFFRNLFSALRGVWFASVL